MKKAKARLDILRKDKSGFTTLDFLFSIILSFGLCIFFFVFCVTLTAAEVAQYIAYSSARAMSASDRDPDAQISNGRTKYKALLTDSTKKGIGGLFNQNAGWFALSDANKLDLKGGVAAGGDFSGIYAPPNDGSGPSGIPFVGVRTELTAKLLSLKIPFLGETNANKDGFKTFITGFLIREPSQAECNQFFKARTQQIRTLDGRFSQATSWDAAPLDTEDNAC